MDKPTSFHVDVVENPSRRTRQGFLLFGIAVAGKRADTTARKLREFLKFGALDLDTMLPFQKLRWMASRGLIEHRLRRVKMGRYSILTRAYRYIAGNDELQFSLLDRLDPEDLEKIPGVGMKTSRYFILYTQPNRRDVAALDTHILKFLRDFGLPDIPDQTPSNRTKYLHLEKMFCCLAFYNYSCTPRQLDDRVWRYYARGEETGLWTRKAPA